MMTTTLSTVALLFLANVFMTFAWYGHLRNFAEKPLWIAILTSWGIAFFEYCLQVPANRLGHGALSLAQLKVAQEVVTMTVFAGFAVWYMGVPLTRNFVYAGLCLVAAAYFIFRDAAPRAESSDGSPPGSETAPGNGAGGSRPQGPGP
jgi:uncharacterized protein (DUF486 family)